MKVTLGVILAGGFPVPGDFVISYSMLMQTLMQNMDGSNIDSARVLFERNFPIDWARNHCCTSFLDHDNGDYLLFLDADMIHPPDMPHRLVAHGKDVVTAHYVARRPPHFTVAMRKVGEAATEYQTISKLVPEEKGLLEVDAAGAGALLISRACLKAIRARIGDDWFKYQDGPDGLRSRSEDMWFFEQAKAAGFQAYLDADVKCQHLTQFAVDHRYHEPYKQAHLDALARQKDAEVTA